jgi:predicted Holliday junction resolvase-like endonuclease
MKLKPIIVTVIVASLCIAACGKKEAKELKDETATKMEEMKKDVVKETKDAGAKAKEVGQAVEKKAEEMKAEAAPKIQELKDATVQKLDDAKAAIHEATEPTPTPDATSTPVPDPMQ